MIQPGFYPAGGGKIQISVTPAQKPAPLELTTRTFNHIGCKAVCAQLPGHIAIRELNIVREKFQVSDEHLDIVQLGNMAQAGTGRFLTGNPTSHTLTNMETIKKFLDVSFQLNKVKSDIWEIRL